jgi:hypothetical protein
MVHTLCMLDKQDYKHRHAYAHAPGHPHTHVRTPAVWQNVEFLVVKTRGTCSNYWAMNGKQAIESY